MRRENGGKDFRLYLRQQITNGRARKTAPPPAPPPKPPGYQPGAWPAGTQAAEAPAQHHPPADWEEALDEYREWVNTADHVELTNRTDVRQKCGCAACTPRSDT